MEQFDRATPAVPLVHDGRLEGGDSTDPMKSDVREWTEDIVQHFLKTSKNGRFRHLVSDFQLIDGIQLFNFTEPQMKSICGVALGSALYDSIHGNRAHDRRAREAIIELEEQLGFYSRATLPPLLQVPSIATVLFVCLFFAGVSLLIFVFEQPLQDFFRCIPTFDVKNETQADRPTGLEQYGKIYEGKISPYQVRLCTVIIVEYASIPLISVVFTYFHIWLALWMVFYPVRFVGCCQIPYTNIGFPMGWQGIVPYKAEKMARKATQLMTTKLLNIREVFGRLDGQRLAEEIEPALHSMLGPIVHSVAEEEIPRVWGSLPAGVKDEIIFRAEEDSPKIISSMMEDMKHNIESVFNLEEMVVDAFTSDPQLLNDMFIKCGYEELAVIRDFAAWMGFFCGMIQLILWYIYPYHLWTLPVFAGVVGMLTNYAALLMIFKPRYPTKVCGITFQGLFLARQQQVSAGFAYLVTRDILTTKSLLHELLRGHSSDALVTLIYGHVRQCIDERAGVATPLVSARLLPATRLAKLKDKLSDRIVNDMMPQMIFAAERYMEETLDLQRTLHEKMSALTPKSFEELLRPVFEEDEWKLIALGGALGVGIGFLQTYLLGM